MPSSNSRIISKCKNYSLYEKIIEIHKHNNGIKKLLLDIKQWDIQVINQYKQIMKFHCLVCHFKTDIFIDWKCHIMSVSHMKKSHKIEDLFSYVCHNKECKVLLYGSFKCINNHKNKHSETNGILGVSILMAKVMERYITKLTKPLHYCSHCKKFAEEPIHDIDESNKNGLKCFIKYFCKFCKVSFISSPEMLDYHSLSVEHLTLKCLNKICTKAKIVAIKKPSIKLPKIVLNRFHNINQYHGDCKLCSNSINWDNENIRLHLLKCKYKFNIAGSNKTKIKTFKCNVCDYSTNDFNRHKSHIISLLHLTNCQDTSNYYSYSCDICNTFMYSDTNTIKNHIKKYHKSTNATKLPMLSSFMALMFKNFNMNTERKKLLHYYSNNESKEHTKDSQQCHACKIVFHDSIKEYEMHEITSEHIILKFLMTEIDLRNTDNLTLICDAQTTESNSVVNNILLKKVSDQEYVPNFKITKNQTNVGGNCTELTNKVKTPQKPLVTSICVEELDNDVSSGSSESNKNIESLSGHGKQYTKYYKHKINLLNLFQQYRDSIIRTPSFYCNDCDYITEEKYSWDKHNKTVHLDVDSRFTIYCSTCSMSIVSRNNEEHNNTTEHCIFLQFLQSLKYTEESLVEKTLGETVKVNPLECKPHIDMKIQKNVKYVDVSTSTDDIYLFDSINVNKYETVQDDIVDQKLNHEISSSFDKPTSSLCSLQTRDTLFLEDRKNNDIYDNIAYGNYVTKRLNNIENSTIKDDIKLEIDNIFYTKIKEISNNTK